MFRQLLYIYKVLTPRYSENTLLHMCLSADLINYVNVNTCRCITLQSNVFLIRVDMEKDINIIHGPVS